MKLNKNSVIIFIVSCINIFLAIPFAIFNIYIQKNKKGYVLLSVLIAGIAWYFIPSTEDYDIARYYRSFSDNKLFIDTINYQNDFYASYYIIFLKKFGLNPKFLAFTSAFITYYFIFKCLLKIKSNKLIVLYMIYIFISIPIIGFSGIRFVPAVSILTYGLIRKRLFWMILASLVHSSCWAIVLLYILTKLIKFNINNIFSKIWLFLCLFLSKYLTVEKWIIIIKYINSFNLVYVTPNYILGKWGIQYLETRETFLSKLVNITIIELGIIIIIFYIFFIYYKRKDNFAFFLGLLIIFFQKIYVFYERYIYIFLTYITLKEVLYFSRKKIKKKLDCNLIILGLILILNIIKLIYDIKRYYPSLVLSYLEIYKISFLRIFINILK